MLVPAAFASNSFSGWPLASNPLLRGPGLLAINDRAFKESDERGITSFGESGKATDNAAIGKFEFGQKAVFHLCDAFIVYSHGEDEPFSTVVNPFFGVNVEGNVTKEWEPASQPRTNRERPSTRRAKEPWISGIAA